MVTTSMISNLATLALASSFMAFRVTASGPSLNDGDVSIYADTDCKKGFYAEYPDNLLKNPCNRDGTCKELLPVPDGSPSQSVLIVNNLKEFVSDPEHVITCYIWMAVGCLGQFQFLARVALNSTTGCFFTNEVGDFGSMKCYMGSC
jgi:hypothetical protein